MSDAELQRMTINELMDLKARAEDAIRARIRARREAKDSGSRPAGAPGSSGPPAARDIESDFNAWMKSRR